MKRPINMKEALIGLVKKIVGSPSEMTKDLRRFCSTIGPRIMERRIGDPGYS